MTISTQQVADVLSALGEDFLVDIEAVHTPGGHYLLSYWTLVDRFVNAPDVWLEQITEYINAREPVSEV